MRPSERTPLRPAPGLLPGPSSRREPALILILSKSSHEASTDEVIDWLDARGASFLRINGADLRGDEAVRFLLPEKHLEIDLEARALTLPSEEVGAVWYRRWQDNAGDRPVRLFTPPSEDSIRATQTIFQSIDLDTRRASEILFDFLDDKRWLSRPATTRPNKFRVLELASEAHLDIPRTLVTTRKKDVESFKRSCDSIIAKALNESCVVSADGRVWATYTVELGDREIEALPDSFPVSLFQEKIPKEYEIRVFTLEDRFYSMAIFSQLDPRTSTDFRRYNYSKPNRFVPYSLPEDLRSKLRQLLRSLELDTASIDLLKSTDGKVVFLEINPIGQFGMVSEPCNYYLEREIADLLIQRDEESRRSKPK